MCSARRRLRATQTGRGAGRAVNAHNQKVSANLQKDGKKPNILVIWATTSAG